jgi:hypothetical protein
VQQQYPKLILEKYRPLGKTTILTFKIFPSRERKEGTYYKLQNIDSLSICQKNISLSLNPEVIIIITQRY